MSRFYQQSPKFMHAPHTWNPPTDVIELAGEIVIRMEIAGLDEQHLDIVAQGTLLMIQGRRDTRRGEIRGQYHLMEVAYGQFERVFDFSQALDPNAIEAIYERGFLAVHVRLLNPDPRPVTIKILDGLS